MFIDEYPPMRFLQAFLLAPLAAILLAFVPASVQAFRDTPAAIEFRQQEAEAHLAKVLPLLIGNVELAQVRRALATAAGRQPASSDVSPQPVSRLFLADLRIVYVVDNNDPAPLVTEGQLAEWDVDLDTVHARALANLGANFGDIRHKPVGKLPWLHVIDSDDGYAASRLLLVDQWGAIASELGEPLIVGAPSRDVVVFTASRDQQQLEKLRDTVETIEHNQARPVSRRLFIWHREGWRLLD